jgi:predicted Rossmann-fold nucleotide-binding protein
MVGKEYWSGLIKWIKEVMHSQEHNVSITDFDLFQVVDTAEEAVALIDEFYAEYLLSPNF